MSGGRETFRGAGVEEMMGVGRPRHRSGRDGDGYGKGGLGVREV